MRSAVCAAVAVLAGLVFPATAEAAILNGGFEDDLTGWEAIGDYKVETSTFGSGTVEGTSQVFLSTASNEVIDIDNNGNEIVGGDAAPVTFISGLDSLNLEGFLNLSTFLGDESLANLATAEPIEGSAIKQTFTAAAGETLSFSWNFLTNESTGQAAVNDFTYPDFNDFVFATIQSASESKVFSIADTISNFSNSSTSFDNETGFNTFSYTIPTTGSYTLGIGVVDVGEPTRVSGLLVDKVEAVPETSSTTISALGMLLLGAWWRVSVLRRRSQ